VQARRHPRPGCSPPILGCLITSPSQSGLCCGPVPMDLDQRSLVSSHAPAPAFMLGAGAGFVASLITRTSGFSLLTSSA
jgi:hypothetical protein